MKTLPIKMLRDSATLIVPAAFTGWHEIYGTSTKALTRVHVQRTAGMNVTGGDAAELADAPTAELWYDCRVSLPHGLDWIQLFNDAETAGGYLEIVHEGIRYRVQRVDELPNTIGGLHHYRLELIYS